MSVVSSSRTLYRFIILSLSLALGGLTQHPVIASADPVPPNGKSLVLLVDDGAYLQPPRFPLPTSTTPPTNATQNADAANLSAEAQNSMIANGFRRRGLRSTTDYPTYAAACMADPTSAEQLHWLVVDPAQASLQNSKLGVTSSTVRIEWSLFDCNGVDVTPNDNNKAGHVNKELYYANLTQARRNSRRFPLNTALFFVQFTNTIANNVIHAPLISGFSSGAGTVNTALDFVFPVDQFAQTTFNAAADKIAADYCGEVWSGKESIHCLKT